MSSADKKEYEVRLSRRASSYLSRVNNPFKRRIVDALRLMEKNPRNKILDAKLLEGRSGEYRLRVGRYRIVYTVNDMNKTINVATILPRCDAYK